MNAMKPGDVFWTCMPCNDAIQQDVKYHRPYRAVVSNCSINPKDRRVTIESLEPDKYPTRQEIYGDSNDLFAIKDDAIRHYRTLVTETIKELEREIESLRQELLKNPEVK